MPRKKYSKKPSPCKDYALNTIVTIYPLLHTIILNVFLGLLDEDRKEVCLSSFVIQIFRTIFEYH